MKRILLSFGILVFVAAAAAGTTGAFFTDSKRTGDNRFKAGTLSIGVEQTMQGALPVVVDNWAPGETATLEYSVVNKGTLPVHIRTSHAGSWDFAGANPSYFKVTSVQHKTEPAGEWVTLAMSPAGIAGKTYYSADGTEASLVAVAPGKTIRLRNLVSFDPAADNAYQGKSFIANIIVDAKQVTPGATWPQSGGVVASCPSDGSLKIATENGVTTISWSGSVSGSLESASDLINGPWTPVSQSARLIDGCNVITETLPAGSTAKFYRLRATTVPTTEPSFTFTAPAPSSDLQKGKTYTITWTSRHIPATDFVAINVKDVARGTFLNQFARVANTGSVSWTVPSSLASGTYLLSINNCLGGNTSACVSTEGPSFTVKDASAGAASITVTAPAGGEILRPGNTLTVRWTANNVGATERMAIQAKSIATGAFLMLSPSTPNTGSATVSIPADFAAGTYRILVNNCVTGNTSECIVSESGTITVEKAPATGGEGITVTYPANNGIVDQGASYRISWSRGTTPATDRVGISLQSSLGAITQIAASAENNGIYTWTVPATLATGSYKLLFNTCVTGNVSECIVYQGPVITVRAPGVVTPNPTPVGTPSIEIYSPTGATSVTADSSFWVGWKTTNIPAGDKLALNLKHVDTGRFLSIFPQMENSGGFSLQKPDLTPGRYQVVINNCVTGNASECISSESPAFIVR